MKAKAIFAAVFGAMAVTMALARAADPLPSWKEGKAKQSILAFVAKVTKEGAPDFVLPAHRDI
jgi:hypothetical protein